MTNTTFVLISQDCRVRTIPSKNEDGVRFQATKIACHYSGKINKLMFTRFDVRLLLFPETEVFSFRLLVKIHVLLYTLR